jgi:hypothetical protein
MFIPFIDHVLQHLNDRFPPKLMPLMLAWYLIPCNVSSLNDEYVQAIKIEYEGDLPSKMTFEQEINRWRNLCHRNENGHINSLADAASLAATMGMYPNVFAILCLLLSLPVGSCCCERSFSAMRRLKTWQRSSMGQARFSGLALMNIHHKSDVGDIDFDNVLRRFDATGHLRIGKIFSDCQ